MKKSKFLFLVPSVALATSIPFISSCGKTQLSIKDIENAVFNPVIEPQIVEGTFTDQLKSASKKDLQKELIYRLFNPDEEWADEIRGFHDEEKVNMFSNIQTCNIKFENEKVVASFAGYINFVFNKSDEIHNKNDVIQVTFLFDNLDVTPANGAWYLNFVLPSDKLDRAFGFIEWIISGERQLPIVINSLKPQTNIPNWHHWSN